MACRYIVANRVILLVACYSACVPVVYTKEIIHLSISESGEYLPPLFTSTSVNNYRLTHSASELIGIYLHESTNNEREISIPHEAANSSSLLVNECR